MMSRTISMILLCAIYATKIVSAQTSPASNNRTCPANEEFKDCGTACEPSCRNPNPEVCTEQCVVGCQCRSGFYRNEQNVCVSSCPGSSTTSSTSNRTCPANEEFKPCGTACEPSCRNPNPEVCTEQCVVGCQCRSGFYRNDQNVCVSSCPDSQTPPSTSNRTCPANEEFKPCGTACEPSCRRPNPGICTLQCVIGCQCKSGFYRNDENVCVANCSGTGGCGVNEERKQCGTACEPTCAQPNPPCTRQCVPDVCQCRQLYIRDSNNVCVPKASCPTEPVKPCSELNCPSGTRCELGRVICPFVPPCFTQQSRCVPTGSNPAPSVATASGGPTLPLCSQFNCVPNTRCLIRCQPDNDTYPTPPSTNSKVSSISSGITCANVRCRDGYECREGTVNCVRAPCPQPGPQCVPIDTPQRTCDNVRCPAGTECQQVPLNCLLPPCPQPPPQCVKVEQYNPCAATTCPVGSDCRVRQVVCVRAPCNPVAECVPQGPSQGKCGEFESFRDCASQCEPTCSNKNPTCNLSCAPGRCQCNIGFYRNSDGRCVTEADCDGNTNPY
uniref:Trypsin Inhibitor like cysteine rich domain protein n=1 Tax=Haemonchus contortus TaxID=6289 RepID=A0A7I4Z072_HAECO